MELHFVVVGGVEITLFFSHFSSPNSIISRRNHSELWIIFLFSVGGQLVVGELLLPYSEFESVFFLLFHISFVLSGIKISTAIECRLW